MARENDGFTILCMTIYCVRRLLSGAWVSTSGCCGPALVRAKERRSASKRIVVIVLLGGFTLLFPLTRQLGKVLEKKYLEDGTDGTNAEEVAALRRAVQALTGDVERLSEGQDFTEKLLEGPRPED